MLKRRWRSSPAGKTKLKRYVLIGLLIGFLFVLQTYLYMEKNLKQPLVSLAKIRLKQIATQTINTAVSEQVARNTNLDKMIDWRMDKNGKTAGFVLNPTEQMRITSDTIGTVERQMKQLQSIPEHIPLGQAMNSPILASFGPDIPIKLVPAGAAKVDLGTRYQNAGINMILVEVYIRITIEVSVIIPFDSEPEVVETELPVSYALVVGDVPTYYFDGKGNPVGQNGPPPGVALPGALQKPQAASK
ncbi:sporulation protein YunB [Paenibacillus filicis]|uniref:Sporulation protein YunB n=1 Tax=Paenibacillus gyeongsangnamensis TaxID=3388067 RepID=A0ABT4QAR2_9BACL|nr:sporulation protein YunB [Paenibacillus filicis]MCZ8513775.1 sporulation protein YunB [Paenibacillus filicis]